MQTRFMGISHGSSWQHVTVWSIFGNGRYPGTEPEAVHSGPGCMPIPLHALLLIGSIVLNFEWTFKVEENVTGQIKRGRSCVSPLCFREELSVESARVCHAVENTHNIPMMWHYPRNFILLPWPDVYSLFPSGSAHWSLRAILKEEAA